MSNLLKIVLPLILLAAVAFLVWRFAFAPAAETNNNANDKPPAGATSASEDKTGLGAVGNLTEMLSQSAAMIKGIRNPQTAELAAQQLDQFTDSLDISALSKLPGPAKMATRGAIFGFQDTIDEMLEKTYEIAGVEDVLKPSVDRLMNKLGRFGE